MSLLHAVQAYLEALDVELHFWALIGSISPLTSLAPSLDIVLEQLAHTVMLGLGRVERRLES